MITNRKVFYISGIIILGLGGLFFYSMGINFISGVGAAVEVLVIFGAAKLIQINLNQSRGVLLIAQSRIRNGEQHLCHNAIQLIDYIKSGNSASEKWKDIDEPYSISSKIRCIYRILANSTNEDLSVLDNHSEVHRGAILELKQRAEKFFQMSDDRAIAAVKRAERTSDRTGKDVMEILREESSEFDKREDEKTRRGEEQKAAMAKRGFQLVSGKCPYCFNNISKLATKCPHCTADL